MMGWKHFWTHVAIIWLLLKKQHSPPPLSVCQGPKAKEKWHKSDSSYLCAIFNVFWSHLISFALFLKAKVFMREVVLLFFWIRSFGWLQNLEFNSQIQLWLQWQQLTAHRKDGRIIIKKTNIQFRIYFFYFMLHYRLLNAWFWLVDKCSKVCF